MAVTDVTHKGEVVINDKRYPLAKDNAGRHIPVSTSPGQRYAQKFVLGDFGTESRERVSVIRWDDFRGGALLERFNGEPELMNRFLDTQGVDTRFFHSITLSPLQTVTSSAPSPGSNVPHKLAELNKEVYGAFGTAVHKYDNGGDTWGASVNTLTQDVTDGITAVIGGTENLIFCTGTDYEYSTDGSTWNNSTKDTLKMAVWDDRLWGIDSNGQLWYTFTVGSGETDDAQLPLVPALTNEDAVGALFVGPNAVGEPILYATCRMGLFAHDAANQRWIDTKAIPPFGQNLGNDAIAWRNRIYVALGTAVFEYSPINGTVRSVGLDQDDGLNSGWGDIVALTASYNDLFVVTSDNSSTGQLFAWNGVGWRGFVTSGTNEGTDILVSSAYNAYRLWWSADRNNPSIRYIALQTSQVKPKNISGYGYVSNGTLTLPWFEVGPDVDGIALRIKVETDDCDSGGNEITVSYRVNDAGSFTSFAAITSDGVTTFQFPNENTPTGTAFRNIQFRIVMDRDGTTTNSPILESLSLEFVRRLPVRYSHQAVIDVGKSYKGRTPLDMVKDLRTAFENSTKVTFGYKDGGQDANGDFLSYVEVVDLQGLEETGHNWGDTVTVFVSDS